MTLELPLISTVQVSETRNSMEKKRIARNAQPCESLRVRLSGRWHRVADLALVLSRLLTCRGTDMMYGHPTCV